MQSLRETTDVLTQCAQKVPYGDEATARIVGRGASSTRRVPLWVYNCPYCTSWHLTKQEGTREANVFAPMSTLQDFMPVANDESLWETLSGMPVLEAVRLLRSVSRRISGESLRASKSRQITLLALRRQVEDELYVKSRCLTRKQWVDSIQALFGQDGSDRFREAIEERSSREASHLDCSTVHRYPDEVACRQAGQSQSAADGQVRWVYPCGYCGGWHLTTRARDSYWEVSTPLDELDDYADLLADKHFWLRLVDMNRDDAETMLRRTTYRVLQQHQHATGGTQLRCARLLARLRSETHLVHSSSSDHPPKAMIGSLFGDDAVELVWATVNALRAEQS